MHSLTTPPQREHHAVGFARRHGRDRDGSLELCHGRDERIFQVDAVTQLARHEAGDDLCVGGDRLCDADPVFDLQVGVVVDVAVQHRENQR